MDFAVLSGLMATPACPSWTRGSPANGSRITTSGRISSRFPRAPRASRPSTRTTWLRRSWPRSPPSRHTARARAGRRPPRSRSCGAPLLVAGAPLTARGRRSRTGPSSTSTGGSPRGASTTPTDHGVAALHASASGTSIRTLSRSRSSSPSPGSRDGLRRCPGTLLDGVLSRSRPLRESVGPPGAPSRLAAGNLMARPFGAAALRSVFSVLARDPVPRSVPRSPRPALHGLTFWKEATTAGDAFLHFGASASSPRSRSASRSCARSRARTARSSPRRPFRRFGLALAVLTKKPVFCLAAAFLAGVLWLLLRPRPDGEARPRGRAQGGLPLRRRRRGPRLRAGRRPRGATRTATSSAG